MGILTTSDARSLMSDLCDLIDGCMESVQRTRYEVTWKDDGSPVTASDVFLENEVKAFLSERLPSLSFYGEESFEEKFSQSNEGYRAVLDPIDGTENFCSGLKEWGVSFSLWHSDKHLGSLLYLPELGERIMTGDHITPVKSRIRGFSSSMNQTILDEMATNSENRMMGCSVYNMFNVIRGSFARFTNPRGAYSWDLMAGLMLALEHNCEVILEGAEYNGQYLEPGRKYRFDVRHRYDLHSR